MKKMKKHLKFILLLIIFIVQVFSLMPNDSQILDVDKENLNAIE